ncbi:oligopeptide/dipeptide ABC transporter ATP-binding protein [Candidatus Nitrosotenuis sp. DW1]|uniref:oligopeptide/dipeptide ABC transporter ATP-binding protein n=1 Tax=Candidatus Nitrosotenuis sp. DW1 TaxID=2259672 RepID=UPI0015CEA962|nr:oligopeptide/dipeptide ABC transporter ATP-binding protein [Candidatus Nitrosotenuis sp. DW1]QLH08713.1 ABC transporter ATP-binding protein [Candidatus Nitrosotenuis sp. DW1]
MDEILIVENLQKYFIKTNWLGKQSSLVKAVDGISFSVRRGEIFVLAGESGSGKSTIAKLILKSIDSDAGKITFDGAEISNKKESLKRIRMGCQMVYQDPYDSINPRMKVKDIVSEPIEIHKIGNAKQREDLVREALHEVRLEPADEIMEKYPGALSGGQRQRVVLARALVMKPKMIIADEPVSMLDVSVRAEILELMENLRQKYNISFVYITHDLATAKYFGHAIAIIYLGKIVEMGPINDILLHPKHPYTQALLDAISEPDPNNIYKEKIVRVREPLDIDAYQGCRFQARCPYAFEKCKIEPNLEDIGNNRKVACFAKLD